MDKLILLFFVVFFILFVFYMLKNTSNKEKKRVMDKLLIQKILGLVIFIQVIFFIRAEYNYKNISKEINNASYDSTREIEELKIEIEELKKEFEKNTREIDAREAQKNWKEIIKGY